MVLRELGNAWSAVGTREALERGRMLAIGALGSGVVHEIANLLTVVDGLRQMGEMGLADSWRPDLVAKPAARCEDLVCAFRALFSDDPSSHVSLWESIQWIGILVRVRLRGCQTRVEFERIDQPIAIDGRHAAAIRVAVVCAALAALDEICAFHSDPELISIRTEEIPSAGGRITLTATPGQRLLTTPRATAAELWGAAQTLLAPIGGTAAYDATTQQLRVEIEFPIVPRTSTV